MSNFYSSQVAKSVPFDNSTNGFTAGDVQAAIEEAKSSTPKRSFFAEILYSGAMSNASWFNRHGNHTSGSYSGWPSGWPFVVPFGCALTRVLIGLSGASFDYRSSSGNIYIQLAAYTHAYNGTTQAMLIDTTITGSYSGSSFTGQNTKKEITTWTVNSGSVSFTKHDIIGFQFRKDISKAGQCYNITNSYLLLEFTEA